MWLFIVTLIFYLGSKSALSELYSKDVDHVLFGDFTSLENLFAKADVIMSSTTIQHVPEGNVVQEGLLHSFGTLDQDDNYWTNYAQEEYEKITTFLDEFLAKIDSSTSVKTDSNVHDTMTDLVNQARLKTATALKNIAAYQYSTSFKIGFLSNRIDKIRGEQHSIIEKATKKVNDSETVDEESTTFMTMIENVNGFDVHLRKTCAAILNTDLGYADEKIIIDY